MITQADRVYVFERDDHRCRYCASPKRLETDHVLPRSWMLRAKAPEVHIDATWNLQTLCHDCNERKGCRIPDPQEIERIRTIDSIYQKKAQMSADRDIEELRKLPILADLEAVWEHLTQVRKAQREFPSDLDLPQYWEQHALDLIEKGATQDDLYHAADRATAPSTHRPWAYFLRVVENRIEKRADRDDVQLYLFGKRDA